MPAATKTISAADSWTDPVHIIGDFNLSIVASTSPAFSGTVTVQRSSDGTNYRAGIKTGEYSAGSVSLTLNGYDTWPPRF